MTEPRSLGSLSLALALTLGYAAIEAAAGFWSGSLTLLADAGHMASDAASLGLAAFAAWAARRPPSARHSYGFGRAEIVAAFVNAAFMLVILVWITVAAVQRLLEPQAVKGETVFAVALIGLLLNVAVALILARGEKTMNTRGALLHVMGDLLGSVAALVSGAVISFTGWFAIDPLLSLFICALILVSSLRLLREALHALMEGTPLHLALDEIGKAMAAVEGVRSVHDLHVWSLSSERIALSAHVVIDDMAAWERVFCALAQTVDQRYGIRHVTLQPEPSARIMQPPAVEPQK
ncbi:cation diffusion facilitator family transporter [Sulfuricaulis sp.]|uniref:cation diffusion facilitator family transporter n=1 Tax=Sulfuricaulis sp. TaxID=2003553 RepID=UPI00355993FB